MRKLGLSGPLRQPRVDLEPGRYIDSAGTASEHLPLILSVEPRFVLNKFSPFTNADLGLSALRISDVQSGTKKYDDSLRRWPLPASGRRRSTTSARPSA